MQMFFVPFSHRKKSIVEITNRLMLLMKIFGVCSENHTKLINTSCGHIAVVFNIKSSGTFSCCNNFKG
jgi:hypothetical protein